MKLGSPIHHGRTIINYLQLMSQSRVSEFGLVVAGKLQHAWEHLEDFAWKIQYGYESKPW